MEGIAAVLGTGYAGPAWLPAALLVLFSLWSVILAVILLLEVAGGRQKPDLPGLIDEINRAGKGNIPGVVKKSAVPDRQKKALIELTMHRRLTNASRESLSARLVFEERHAFEKKAALYAITLKADIFICIICAFMIFSARGLSQGAVFAAAASVLTCVLMFAAYAYARYSKNSMSVFETLSSCVLDAERNENEARLTEETERGIAEAVRAGGNNEIRLDAETTGMIDRYIVAVLREPDVVEKMKDMSDEEKAAVVRKLRDRQEERFKAMRRLEMKLREAEESEKDETQDEQ